MTQPSNTHLKCPVVVLTIAPSEIRDDKACDELRDQLLAVAIKSEADNVVLDFHRVTYLSSAGFRPLLSLHRLLRQKNGRLVLCGLSDRVAEIFEVTRLISTKGVAKAPFDVQPDPPSAVAFLFSLPPSEDEITTTTT